MNLRIETLRGLACLLLVTYHVIGADPGLGLRVEDGTLRWLNDGLAYLRMPLFTLLSGLVYGLRPFGGNTRSFLLGKVRRLLIPMLVVGTLFALLQFATPGANSTVGSWYLLHLKPVAHFWFVESLFWVFLLIWALERLGQISHGRGFALVLALACALYFGVRGWPWVGIEGAIYLLPYFLAGLACSRFALEPQLRQPWVRLALALVALTAAVSMGLPVPNPDRRSLAILLVGVSLCLLCLGSGASSRWLAGIGRRSYAIYLFHVFFTAACRIALARTGVTSLPLDLLLGISMGLAGPMLIELGCTGHRWPSLLLLGKSIRGIRTANPGPQAQRQVSHG